MPSVAYQVLKSACGVLARGSSLALTRKIGLSSVPLLRTSNYCSQLTVSRKFSRTSVSFEQPRLIGVTFVLGDGTRLTAKGKVGDTLYDVKVNNNLDIEGYGACEGNLSCSTCHLILKQADYDRIPPVDHDEQDVLDTAIGVTETSRLGCQIFLQEDMDGLEVHVPLERHDRRGDS